MTTCIEPGCQRARISTSANGTSWAMCDAHTCASLAAFGSAAWHAQARADVLRTAVVGGVPTSTVTTARSALEPRVVSPELPWVASAERAAVAAG